MKKSENFLFAALVAGVWTLVGLQVTASSPTLAQETPVVEEAEADREAQGDTVMIHASDVIGLSAMIEATIRTRQTMTQSTSSLDQRIKSIVRRCKVSGTVSGNRLSAANISC